MRALILSLVGLLFFATLAGAQESGDEDPAMKAQNPLANIISMPFRTTPTLESVNLTGPRTS